VDRRLTATASPATTPAPASTAAESASAATLVARAADEYLERLRGCEKFVI
jgi:hypothetical protein